jgi:hypothetical protein
MGLGVLGLTSEKTGVFSTAISWKMKEEKHPVFNADTSENKAYHPTVSQT